MISLHSTQNLHEYQHHRRGGGGNGASDDVAEAAVTRKAHVQAPVLLHGFLLIGKVVIGCRPRRRERKEKLRGKNQL